MGLYLILLEGGSVLFSSCPEPESLFPQCLIRPRKRKKWSSIDDGLPRDRASSSWPIKL